MTVLILHGIGGYAGIHWQQWLHNELIQKGYQVIMPNLPNPNHPSRRDWFITVSSLLKNIDTNNLIIVGHSLGVTTALDVVESLNSQVKSLISVSGFAKDYGSKLNTKFLSEKNINLKKVKTNLLAGSIIFSDNDPYVPQNILYDLANELGIKPIIIPSSGHLNSDTGYTAFPQLLEIIEKVKNTG